MRARTNWKKTSQSPKSLRYENGQRPLHPQEEGTENHSEQSETILPEQKTAAPSPKGKSEVSGHPPERSGNARSTTRHTTNSWRRQPSSPYFRRRKGIGSHSTTRKADRRGECPPCHTTSVCRSHRRTSDDGAYWNRRPPTHTAVDRTNRAQQWQRKEA